MEGSTVTALIVFPISWNSWKKQGKQHYAFGIPDHRMKSEAALTLRMYCTEGTSGSKEQISRDVLCDRCVHVNIPPTVLRRSLQP